MKLQSALIQVVIVRILSVTRGAVSQWFPIYRKKGLEALRYGKITNSIVSFLTNKRMSCVCSRCQDISSTRGTCGRFHTWLDRILLSAPPNAMRRSGKNDFTKMVGNEKNLEEERTIIFCRQVGFFSRHLHAAHMHPWEKLLQS